MLRTLIGAAEMLKLGITSLMDDAFFVPLTTRSSIDAIASAYEEIGIRATLALDQPIVVEYEKYPFLREILPEEVRRIMESAPRETAGGMLDHYAHLIGRWHGAGEGRIAAAVSCSAPQRATEDYLRALHTLSREQDIPYFCHILETKLQRVLGEEKYGQSLVKYVDQLGILDERMQVIHSIWVDEEDIAILGKVRRRRRAQPGLQHAARQRRHAVQGAAGLPACRSASALTKRSATTATIFGAQSRQRALFMR